MSYLQCAKTCPDCPVFNLPASERGVIDVNFSWGKSMRQFAVESVRWGANPDDVVQDLGYEYRAVGPQVLAVVGCAVRQVVTLDCAFADG